MNRLLPFYVGEGSKLFVLVQLVMAVGNGVVAGVTIGIATLIVKAVL